MSFKYRAIGYSPEYANTSLSKDNDFFNTNTLKGATGALVVESGASVTVEAGGIFTAPSGTVSLTGTTFVNDTDVINKKFADDTYLNIAGDTMTGALVLTNNVTQSGTGTFTTGTGAVSLNGNTTIGAGKTLTLAAGPTVDLHAATKKYADDGLALKLNLAGGVMTGALSLVAPTDAAHAASKSYVDAKLGVFSAGAGLSINQLTMTGAVTSITVTNGGSGYVSAPNVTFTGGTPERSATATAYINGGAVTAVIVTDSGAGYDSVPTIGFSSGTAAATAYVGGYVNNVFVESTTLAVAENSLNLAVTNAWTPDTYYDRVKVDTYGRVTTARVPPTISTTTGDGWYNKIRIQGNDLTALALEDYLLTVPTITATGTDITGTSSNNVNKTVNLNLSLATRPGLAGGTYTKVSVNTKGIVTAASALSASDISAALGYVPLRDSSAKLTHYKGTFQSSSWGTSPFNLTYNSGYAGYTVSGTYLYLPPGIYNLTYWGTNNWYDWYMAYSAWNWWSSYWTYYYNPAVIYHNGKVISSGFANNGGYWWFYNSSFRSAEAQDFLLVNTIEVTGAGEYVQFGVPNMSGTTFWYNIKVLKLK
jgi:hypothetical protein